jgi:hypothetical protein
VHEPRSCSAGNLAAKPPLTRHLRCDPRAFTLFDHHDHTPVSFDADYKHGNVVERFFNRMKNWRGLASRYDKLAVVFRGSVVLATTSAKKPLNRGHNDLRLEY